MVAIGSRAGVTPLSPGVGWAPPTGPAIGNDVPAKTGVWSSAPPGPAPAGQVAAGQLGGDDGVTGADPRSLQTDPEHVSVLGVGQESWARYGIQGFNDQLTVKDRHGYWASGSSLNSDAPTSPVGNPPNPLTDYPHHGRPAWRLVNRTVSFQIGSDNTAQQDDLSRPYTWLGEQGSGWSPVYGGVPGLYQPYGTRGGVPYPIVDPTQGQGGREMVWSGPPHGLHSLTYPNGADTLQRYRTTPQQQPGRVDRPSNSPQAGQSYSQTVQRQGGPARVTGQAAPAPVKWQGRGWAGGQL
ncbi:MAG: hypothetical protein M0030_04495 [Actinomycetota bacterium]|nr:hypothetical protein [Actinomycetota bacterium]